MRYALLFAAAVVLVSCNSGTNQSKPAPQPPAQSVANPRKATQPVEAETQVEMVNVNIHLDPVLVLHIRHLVGKFLPTKKGQPPTFDDKLSYIVAIDSAEVGVSLASMTYAMNTYVFGEPDAPLKNLQLSREGGEIKQTGTLKKGIGIPFEMVGDHEPDAGWKDPHPPYAGEGGPFAREGPHETVRARHGQDDQHQEYQGLHRRR